MQGRTSQLQRLAEIFLRLNAARDVCSVLGVMTEEARNLIGAHKAVGPAGHRSELAFDDLLCLVVSTVSRTGWPILTITTCPISRICRLTSGTDPRGSR